MKKRFTLLMVACSVILCSCGDSTSEPEDLSYVDENGEKVSIEVSTSSFKDSRDGKSYKTVTVGEQTWMAENLAYESSDNKYGWGSAQTICPEGWHLPLKREWTDLFKVIENVYGDSAGWALKSTSGWDNDTTKHGIISGNGENILGFNIKPTGICRGYDCRYLNSMTGFWVQGKVDRDGYAYYIRFETDEDWHSNDIYTDARLNVRCISDKGTIFESLGKCTEEKEGKVGEHDSTYYVCKENLWETASMEEKLNFVLGECNAEIAQKRFMLQDTSFMCETSTGTTYYEGDWVETTSYSWQYTPRDTVFADCSAKGDTICQFRDSTFFHDLFWSEAHIKNIARCNNEINGKIVSLNKREFICRDTTWEVANEAYKKMGLCDKAHDLDTVEVISEGKDTLNYVCIYNRWQPYQPIEYALGFCKNEGAKGTYLENEFVCDAKQHVWYHSFTDKRDNNTYKSVALRNMLVMAENLRYDGDSLFLWHTALALDVACDSTECAETSFNPDQHQGICPDGWSLLSKSDAEMLLHTYANQSTYSADTWNPDFDAYFTPTGWPNNFGTNRSGLNFTPYTMYTEYEPLRESTTLVLTPRGLEERPITVGGEPREYQYRSGTWLSTEYSRNYAYILRLDQFKAATETNNVYYINATTDSKYKTEKAAVRCKKNLEAELLSN